MLFVSVCIGQLNQVCSCLIVLAVGSVPLVLSLWQKRGYWGIVCLNIGKEMRFILYRAGVRINKFLLFEVMVFAAYVLLVVDIYIQELVLILVFDNGQVLIYSIGLVDLAKDQISVDSLQLKIRVGIISSSS